MTLVHTDESEVALKSDGYDEKYMKIRFSSDEDLPLKKALESTSFLK